VKNLKREKKKKENLFSPVKQERSLKKKVYAMKEKKEE